MQSPVAVATLKRIAKGRLRRSEDEQDLLEYGLLASILALVALGAVTVMIGQRMQGVFWSAIANNF